MYSILDFGNMIADKGRMDTYIKALRQSVNHESIVLDIGTGTGIFALLACRYGAYKVYAIEPNDTIQVAKDLAEANGYSDRIEFIQDISTRVELPERPNVIISDLRGRLPLFRHNIPSIIDARRRFLAPDGIMIPAQDTLFAAVVESHSLFEKYNSPWVNDELGINLRPVVRKVMNTTWGRKISDENLLTESQHWVTLNYNAIEVPNVSGMLKWIVKRDGIAHGIRVWFDTEVAPGLGFSNAPEQLEHVYGSEFFPWLEPVSLKSGDGVSVSFQAVLVDEDYIWRWNSKICEQNDPTKVKASFNQSSFDAASLSMEKLRKTEVSFKPELNDQGLVDLQIIRLMEKRFSLEEIARQIKEGFPKKYNDMQQALIHVSELSSKYSK